MQYKQLQGIEFGEIDLRWEAVRQPIGVAERLFVFLELARRG